MKFGKSPASRKTHRGLSMALFLLSAIPFCVFVSVPRPASASVSVSQGFYDYQSPVSGVSRLTGQAVSWMQDRDTYSVGINLERAGFVDAAGAVRCAFYNVSLLLEKPVVKGIMVGGGIGFVRSYFNGTAFALSQINDIYGRVQLLQIGGASVGTFIAVRWLNPTPLGTTIRVFKSGLEVRFGK